MTSGYTWSRITDEDLERTSGYAGATSGTREAIPLSMKETKLKRASYRDAIDFIACNDESAETDPETVQSLASVLLVACIFGTEPERVARDVVRLRAKYTKAGAL